MLPFLLGRVVQLILLLFVSSIAVWLMILLIPGDPAATRVGPDATPEQLAHMRREMGLDQPLAVQYLVWLNGAIHGDLGRSLHTRLPVTETLARRIPPTLHLAASALVLALVVALPLGVLAAVRPQSLSGRIISAYASLTLAVPTFWVGILLVLIFAVSLRLLPSSGYIPIWEDPGRSLVRLLLPAFTMSLYLSGLIVRFLRAAMLDVLRQDYVQTARAKGLGEMLVVTRHVLRNALIPVVTVVGLQFGHFLGGTVVTESIFNYPGVGRLLLDAVHLRDYTVIQGTIMLIVITFSIVSLLVDIIYTALDPRIRVS